MKKKSDDKVVETKELGTLQVEIPLDKRERRELTALQAWQREVQATVSPFEAAISEFLVELQEKYSVTLNVTHALNPDRMVLIPLATLPEPPKEAPSDSNV